jgi:hypothetical protein
MLEGGRHECSPTLGALAKVKALALGYLGVFSRDSYLWLFFLKRSSNFGGRTKYSYLQLTSKCGMTFRLKSIVEWCETTLLWTKYLDQQEHI